MRSLSASLFISVTSAPLIGQTYTAAPFAGSELPPHDIPAVVAGLGPVRGVAVDAAGNVFMSLSLYNSVVRLDASTGILSLVAGNGTYGYGGDNGPATSAQLLAPQGLAVDSAGNLYIADAGNLHIRKVSNGVISTIAGNGTPGYSGDNGPAANAQFGQALTIGEEDPDTLAGPRGVAVDSAGNVYIADAANNRIRKVSGGVITTIAGDGTSGFGGDGGQAIGARLSMPWGVAADSAGNMYIADRGNLRVRKVADGLISTLAGNGTQGLSGDNGAAVNAQLGNPYGVAVDSAGSGYIADALNNRIRKVANGVMTTAAGNGTAGFSGDGGPAISARLSTSIAGIAVNAGNLYIADMFNNRIRQVAEGTITTVAGDGALRFGGDNRPAVNAQLYDP